MALSYSDYLHLDIILTAQAPISALAGKLIHDEHFFIVLHQTHELWFKQILVDIDAVLMNYQVLKIEHTNRIMTRLVAIQDMLLAQLQLIANLDKEQFFDLRNHLSMASGGQSVQFRMLEAKLGMGRCSMARKAVSMLELHHQKDVVEAMAGPSLHDGIAHIIGEHYRRNRWDIELGVAYSMCAHLLTELDGILSFPSEIVSTASRGGCFDQLPLCVAVTAFYAYVSDDPRLSKVGVAVTLLGRIEEQVIAWRHLHADMVRLMLGDQRGTGGTSGYSYLKCAAAELPRSAFASILAFANSLPSQIKKTIKNNTQSTPIEYRVVSQ